MQLTPTQARERIAQLRDEIQLLSLDVQAVAGQLRDMKGSPGPDRRKHREHLTRLKAAREQHREELAMLRDALTARRVRSATAAATATETSQRVTERLASRGASDPATDPAARKRRPKR